MSDLVERLRTRAHIRRTIRMNTPEKAHENDRIADLLEEAADEIEQLQYYLKCAQEY